MASEERGGYKIGSRARIAAVAVGAEPKVKIGQGFVIGIISGIARQVHLLGDGFGFVRELTTTFAGDEAVAMPGDEEDVCVNDRLSKRTAARPGVKKGN